MIFKHRNHSWSLVCTSRQDQIGFVVNIVKSRNWCDTDLTCTFHCYLLLSLIVICYCDVLNINIYKLAVILLFRI